MPRRSEPHSPSVAPAQTRLGKRRVHSSPRNKGALAQETLGTVPRNGSYAGTPRTYFFKPGPRRSRVGRRQLHGRGRLQWYWLLQAGCTWWWYWFPGADNASHVYLFFLVVFESSASCSLSLFTSTSIGDQLVCTG